MADDAAGPGEPDNWVIEDEIDQLDTQLRREMGNSFGATYRCATCYRLSIDHPDNNVKGCKVKKLTPDQYLDSIECQRDELKCGVTIITQAQESLSENFARKGGNFAGSR